MRKICTKCKELCPASDNFCGDCGTELEKVKSVKINNIEMDPESVDEESYYS